MANPVTGTHIKISLSRGEARSDGAYVNATYSRVGTNFWGGSNMVSVRGPDGKHQYYWAAPGRDSWYGSGTSFYLLNRNGVRQNLAYGFTTSWGGIGDYNGQRYRWSTSFTQSFFVPISKGNKRKGSKTVSCSAVTQNAVSTWNGTLSADIVLSTTETPLPSNIKINATVDYKSIKLGERKARINISFTNPESYYTCHIDGVARTSHSKLITKGDYNKPVTFTYYFTGKDGQVYVGNTTVYTPVVDPGGIGAWVKVEGKVVKVKEIYCDTAEDKAEELWLRKGRVTLRTVE